MISTAQLITVILTYYGVSYYYVSKNNKDPYLNDWTLTRNFSGIAFKFQWVFVTVCFIIGQIILNYFAEVMRSRSSIVNFYHQKNLVAYNALTKAYHACISLFQEVDENKSFHVKMDNNFREASSCCLESEISLRQERVEAEIIQFCQSIDNESCDKVAQLAANKKQELTKKVSKQLERYLQVVQVLIRKGLPVPDDYHIVMGEGSPPAAVSPFTRSGDAGICKKDLQELGVDIKGFHPLDESWLKDDDSSVKLEESQDMKSTRCFDVEECENLAEASVVAEAKPRNCNVHAAKCADLQKKPEDDYYVWVYFERNGKKYKKKRRLRYHPNKYTNINSLLNFGNDSMEPVYRSCSRYSLATLQNEGTEPNNITRNS